MANLELVPRSWLAWNFDVIQDGSPAAEILYPISVKERGSINIGQSSYQVYREHLTGGKFLLEESGRLVASAGKPSALRDVFQIQYGEREYTLAKASFFGRRFILSDAIQPLGFIEPLGPFTRKAHISLPDDLPLPVQSFIAWLVLVLWKRESDGAAVTAAVSG